MEYVLSAAEQILQNAGVPALRISHLLREIQASTPGTGALDALRLRTLLEASPERFRVLDPWRGPWRLVARVGPEESGEQEPWVVAVRDHGDGAARDGHRIVRRLHDTVRWLALSLDPLSARSMVRWNELLTETQSAGGGVDHTVRERRVKAG